jgi:hypothetical protein
MLNFKFILPLHLLCLALPASAMTPEEAATDFQTRCKAAGVLKCIGFDDNADVASTTWGTASGLDPTGNTLPELDGSTKASGNSSLKFTIPSNSSSNSSGAYWTNFSDDFSVQFGGNEVFYYQWRQRFDPFFISHSFIGGGGWKQSIVGTGDKPGCSPATAVGGGPCSSSCTSLEVVTQNSYHRQFPQMYNSCTGSSSHAPYYGFEEPFRSEINYYDYKLQNARPAPYCLYSGETSTGFFQPNGNCFGYSANEWMTFQVMIQTGPRIGNEFFGSFVKLWVALDGQPSELVIHWGPFNLSAGSIGDEDKFGKVWLMPYNTSKDPAEVHPPTYTWYDELIISRNKIADPGGVAPPPTADTIAPAVAVISPANNSIVARRTYE